MACPLGKRQVETLLFFSGVGGSARVIGDLWPTIVSLNARGLMEYRYVSQYGWYQVSLTPEGLRCASSEWRRHQGLFAT